MEDKSYKGEPGARIPVYDYPIPITKELKGERSSAVAHHLKNYLSYNSIPCKEDLDMGVRRFTFVFMCADAPGGFVEGCIWFFDKAAEVRLYYNSIGADICKRSEYRGELYRLLNFINARVFMECSDGGNGKYQAPIWYTPRIYLTEDTGYDISITTIINYDFGEKARHETHDYITAYCPELLDRLAPFIFRTLKGEMNVSDAIFGIKREMLNDIYHDGKADTCHKILEMLSF